MKQGLIPTSRLSLNELNWIDDFLKVRPIFCLYHHAALDALKTGLDNRQYLIGEEAEGLVMSIQFDDLRVTTTIGQLSDSELSRVAQLRETGELHVEPSHELFFQKALGSRLFQRKLLKYYLCTAETALSEETHYRRLEAHDFELASEFFNAHHPQTIFSQWMLDQPFIGIFDKADLVATAGTVIANRFLGSANLGNFVTRPDRRGQGLAKQAATALMNELRKSDISIFSLGTTEDNVAAWRAYEAVGFAYLESRPELHIRKN